MSTARRGIRPISLSLVTRLIVSCCFLLRKLVTGLQRCFSCVIAATTLLLLPEMIPFWDIIISAANARSASTVHGVSVGNGFAATHWAATKWSSGDNPKLMTGGLAALCEKAPSCIP